jgi:glycosyltransferase involved in cell wall biosynthesis
MSKISVIVPTFNSAHFLPDCMDSLLTQTIGDFEVIVVDDASIDNTKEVIDRYFTSFLGRLKYIRLEHRVGRGQIRNVGIEQAKGKYIAFLDADDAYLPEKLEVQSRYLDEHPEVVGVSCNYHYCNANLEPQSVTKGLPTYFGTLLGNHYKDFEHGTVAMMLRRDVIEKVGTFDGRITRGQDTDLFIRMARHYRMDFIGVPLFMYRLHDENSGSFKALTERTVSNLLICKNIVDSEPISRKAKVQSFIFEYLSSHIHKIRERNYIISIRAWFLYLWKMNFNLPLLAWFWLGVKVMIGYRVTRAIKGLASRGLSRSWSL